MENNYDETMGQSSTDTDVVGSVEVVEEAVDVTAEENVEAVNETVNGVGTESAGIEKTEADAAEKSSYTSEYGNTVEGQRSSSTYSYSYRDNQNSATRSGDYYANEHQSGSYQQNSGYQNQGGSYQQSSGYQNQGGSYQQNGYQNQGGSYQQSSGYQNQGGSYQQSSGYQNQGGNYQQNGYQSQPGGYRQNSDSNVEKDRDKKQGSFAKKLAVCVALAVVFGVVAGVCFQAVNYVAGKNTAANRKISSISEEKKETSKSVDKVTTAEGNSGTGMTDVSGIVEQTMPAIVAITSTTKGTSYMDLFGQYYQGQDTTSCGSGFIVGQNDSELLIATNNHVIEDAKTISVQFIDDEVYEASVKGTDSANDLAVIAVKLKSIKDSTSDKIKIADLGSSEELKVGQMAIAIGNALGYGQSVTVGYISAKDREIQETSETGKTVNTIKAIQTDAAINPGNSGGALLNLQGQVIGINSAKIAASAVEGVGYAIPISEAMPIIDNLMNKENLTENEKGYLGIKGQTVSDEASTYNIPNGVYVVEVAEGGAADEGGIQTGDIITAIENMEVRTIESLVEKANSYRKGTEVEITLQRSSDGVYKEKKVKVKLQGKSSLNGLSEDESTGQSGDSSGNDGYNGDNGNNGFGGFFNPFGY